jgi:hypothetical protein
MAIRLPASGAALYSPGRILVLMTVRGSINPKAIVRLTGIGKLKTIQSPH